MVNYIAKIKSSILRLSPANAQELGIVFYVNDQDLDGQLSKAELTESLTIGGVDFGGEILVFIN